MKKKTFFLPILTFTLLLTTGCNGLLPTVSRNRKSSLEEETSEIDNSSSKDKSSIGLYSSKEDYTASKNYESTFYPDTTSQEPTILEKTNDDSQVYYYLSNDQTYYIIKGLLDQHYYAGKELILSATHNGLPVKEIAETAFAGADIGGIFIPEGITTMGSNTFVESTIKTASIPSTLRELPFNAFAWTPLKEIALNEGVRVLDQQCFIGCSLEQVVMPSSLEEVGISCFQNCFDLKSVVLNDGLIRIETLAFCRCQSLRSITIPASVTSMRAAFFDCVDINITFASGNNSYKFKDGNLVSYDETELLEFFDTNFLQTYQVEDCVKIVGVYCFAGANIDTVVIKNTIDYIEGGAFNSSFVKRIVFYGTSDEWGRVIRYSGPITDVEDVVIAGPLG